MGPRHLPITVEIYPAWFQFSAIYVTNTLTRFAKKTPCFVSLTTCITISAANSVIMCTSARNPRKNVRGVR